MRNIIVILLLAVCSLDMLAYNLSSSVEEAKKEFANGNIEQAIERIKKAVAVNDVVAQFYLAQCYEYGIGLNQDPVNAFMYYRRAAERGFAPAMKPLARCYELGIGVSVNLSRASEWEARYSKKSEGQSIVDIKDLLSSNSQQQNYSSASNPSTVTPAVANDDKTSKSQISTNPQRNNKIIADIKESQAPKSDVDKDIPLSNHKNEKMFALIIANENYQDAGTVTNAINDGEVFSQYCLKTLGLPQTNIHFVKDATLNNMKREIKWLGNVSAAYKGDLTLLIYYAGHGIPDEKTRSALLMPIDGFVSDHSTCYSLNEFYNAIGKMESKKSIIFMDACFSGASRDGNMLTAARGVAIKPDTGRPTGNVVVISSATGDETAYPYEEQNHGLFTYFLLKMLKETRGQVSLGDLYNNIKDNVTKKSIVVNGKSQTPTVNASEDIFNDWANWNLN